ncbi:Disulfide bond formation protein DsbB [Devosia enhydra]|uniref:Disulfide bond formation protein DsbB n=2 Tax=Devosia enhydra TaxID=665118 RepID=A0A1K2I0H6_9HYPH|nr:Disulfide bond formation protein DsbB [Devosia enhydra]
MVGLGYAACIAAPSGGLCARVATMPLALIRARDKLLAGLAFVLGLATIAAAWGSQLIGGLYPCDLCLEQRWAYYLGLPLLLGILVLWNRLPLALWYVLIAIVAAIFLWGAYMGGYHAGVEWGFWPGPTSCTGTGVSISLSDLQNLNAARIVPCDKVQFRFLGLSLAGYNMLISLGIVGLLVGAMVAQARRRA